MSSVFRMTPYPRPCTHMATVTTVNSLTKGSHISTISRVTTFQDHINSVSYPVSSLTPPPRLYTRVQNSTVSSVTPPSRHYTWGHISAVSRVNLLSGPATGVTSPQSARCPTSANPAPGVTCQSPGRTLSPDPAPGVTHPQSPG